MFLPPLQNPHPPIHVTQLPLPRAYECPSPMSCAKCLLLSIS